MSIDKLKKADLKKHWEKKISNALLGKKMTKVEYLSKQEEDDSMWYKTPIALQLDDKIWLVPMADDEGNDGGSISTTIKDLQVIPTL